MRYELMMDQYNNKVEKMGFNNLGSSVHCTHPPPFPFQHLPPIRSNSTASSSRTHSIVMHNNFFSSSSSSSGA
ncbi:hypothetical protein RIF29_22153 [Crotalaria pallida]|uniref:Uncharacterized protein n=1 Tax=Crotalaria pallida TaxID=3830 RepID=A0AAN9F452_CROPI